MHDPMVVLFSIRRPVPRVRKIRFNAKRRWSFRPPFVRVAGFEAYFPDVVTVWHVEPDGHDSGTVCGRHPHEWRQLVPWTWRHRHHLHLQVAPWQALRRRIWTRCTECGKPFRRHDMVISHGWNGRGPGWRVRQERVYHDKCSGLVSARNNLREARSGLRALGVDQQRLVEAGMDWTKAWRIANGVTDDWTQKEPARR